MSLSLTPGFGLELVARQALLTLVASVNAEIGAQMTIWTPLDVTLNSTLKKPAGGVWIEPVELENFYLGHRPSLVEAPIEKYPNISVMAYEATPEEDFDHFSSYSNGLFVEIMVKSDQDEGEVNARIQRTVDAVANVLMRDRTLNGLVQEIQEPPTAAISDVFVRRREKGRGEPWYWQGARIDFSYQKTSMYR